MRETNDAGRQIPAGWEEVALGVIADVQLGKMLSAKSRVGKHPIPYLRNVNVRWGSIDTSDVFRMDFDARERAKYALVPGDVLVCEGGAPGRAAVWREQLPGALYQKALHRVRFRRAAVDPRLFAYHLEIDALAGLLDRSFTGSTIKHFPREKFLEYPVRVPPLAEQHRIVAAIEEHLTNLDAAVAALVRARANVRRYRAAVLAGAVDGSLVQSERNHPLTGAQSLALLAECLPVEWAWDAVDNLAEVVEYGSSAKTNEDSDGVPVLRMGNIFEGELRLDSLKYLPHDHDEFPKLLLQSGDILFNRTNSAELVGKSAVYRGVPTKASYASYLIRVRLGARIRPEFFAAFLNSRYGREWIGSVVSQQVGQANVSGGKLRMLHVPVPPLAEQHAIVAEVERRLSVVDRTEAQIAIELKRAARLRQSILKRAFEGKLVPQDPNDEPASVLLERMRGNSTAVETRASTTPARSPSAARGMERSARRRPGKR